MSAMTATQIADVLKAEIGEDKVLEVHDDELSGWAKVDRDALVDACRFLRDDARQKTGVTSQCDEVKAPLQVALGELHGLCVNADGHVVLLADIRNAAHCGAVRFVIRIALRRQSQRQSQVCATAADTPACTVGSSSQRACAAASATPRSPMHRRAPGTIRRARDSRSAAFSSWSSRWRAKAATTVPRGPSDSVTQASRSS